MMGGSGPTAWAALTCLGEQYNSTINFTLQDTNHKGPWNVGTMMGGSGPTAWADPNVPGRTVQLNDKLYLTGHKS